MCIHICAYGNMLIQTCMVDTLACHTRGAHSLHHRADSTSCEKDCERQGWADKLDV